PGCCLLSLLGLCPLVPEKGLRTYGKLLAVCRFHKSRSMRPAHPPDSRNVDRRVPRATSRHASYTNQRLEALGASSPPRSGWRPVAAALVAIALVLIGFSWTDLVGFLLAIMEPHVRPCTPVMEVFTDI